MSNRIGALVALCVAVCGCATVKFYTDPALKQKTGFKYYLPKPYLLVTRSGATDKPIEVTVKYLPDRSSPLYAQFRAGMGSHKFNITLADGILTTYGDEGDTKLNETLTAFGSLLSSAGAGYKAAMEGRVEARAAAVAPAGDQAAAARLDGVAQGIEGSLTAATPAMTAAPATLSSAQVAQGRKAADTLREVSRLLRAGLDPGYRDLAISALMCVAESLDTLKIRDGKARIEVQHNETMTEFKRVVESVARDLKRTSPAPKPEIQPSFELYEIDTAKGRLIPVTLAALTGADPGKP